MSSDLDGDDQHYDLTKEEKDREEKRLRAEARELLHNAKRERDRRLLRANEISRSKSSRAHQGRD